MDKFEVTKLLYKADIGNTTVSLVKRKLAASSGLSAGSECAIEKYILKEVDLSYLENQIYRQQSLLEFKIQREMNHENIIRCLEYQVTGNMVRAILEAVDTPEYLQIELDDNMEPISNELMLKTFMSELLEALHYIHSKDVIHCDIKIENILGQTL